MKGIGGRNWWNLMAGIDKQREERRVEHIRCITELGFTLPDSSVISALVAKRCVIP
jgi:hypothetical protein